MGTACWLPVPELRGVSDDRGFVRFERSDDAQDAMDACSNGKLYLDGYKIRAVWKDSDRKRRENKDKKSKDPFMYADPFLPLPMREDKPIRRNERHSRRTDSRSPKRYDERPSRLRNDERTSTLRNNERPCKLRDGERSSTLRNDERNSTLRNDERPSKLRDGDRTSTLRNNERTSTHRLEWDFSLNDERPSKIRDGVRDDERPSKLKNDDRP